MGWLFLFANLFINQPEDDMGKKSESINTEFLSISLLCAIIKAQARIIAKIEEKPEKEVLNDLISLNQSVYQALISGARYTELFQK